MKERPILFSAPMVCALLSGTKIQTRRIVKGIDECPHGYDGVVVGTVPQESRLRGKHCFQLASGESAHLACPYGQPGDRLWVRETWRQAYPKTSHSEGIIYKADASRSLGMDEYDDRHTWKPSIHMFRKHSRITLEVTGVRVQRLQEISEADARAEGITDGGCTSCGNPEPCGCANPTPDAVDAYAHLWMTINGKDSWHLNPWVWVVDFKRL